jgi:hypothetical protein
MTTKCQRERIGRVVADELSEGFENGQVGLARTVLLEALTATDPGPLRTQSVGDEAVDHGRLADPCLAGNEDDPPFAGRGSIEREISAARSVHVRRWRGPPARRRSDRIDLGVSHRADEAIAVAPDRFDVSRRRGIVAQDLADRRTATLMTALVTNVPTQSFWMSSSRPITVPGRAAR